jgi:hypothetical protein
VLNVCYGEIEIELEEREVLKDSRDLCEKIANEKRGVQQKIQRIKTLSDEVIDVMSEILVRHV